MTLEESKFKFMYNIADFMKRRIRWNCALNVSKERLEAKKLYEDILDALTSKGLYDEKSQYKVVESTKVSSKHHVQFVHIVHYKFFFKRSL